MKRFDVAILILFFFLGCILSGCTQAPPETQKTDNEAPVITGDSGNIITGTGNTVTLWVSATDNINVTSAKATIDSVDHPMTYNSSNSHWEYAYTAPSDSTAGHTYTVSVYDLAGNFQTNASRTITVYDSRLIGEWRAEGTKELLVFDKDGTYTVSEGEFANWSTADGGKLWMYGTLYSYALSQNNTVLSITGDGYTRIYKKV